MPSRRIADPQVRAVFALVGIVAVVSVALHLRGFPGSFLSDDFSHLADIATMDRDGRLATWVAQRFVDSLNKGNFGYRPILALSYVGDWELYGAHSSGWHLTNLLLHLVNGALVGALAYRWCRGSGAIAASLAAAAFIAYPFGGEVSFWIAGRADLLAAFFSLLFLHTLGPDGSTSSRSQRVLRVLCLYAALLSKESAAPLPIVAAILVFASVRMPARPRGGLWPRALTTLHEVWPTWIAFAVYLGWRTWLFGSPLKVYPRSSLPSGLGDYLSRLSTLRALIEAQPGLQPDILWPLVAGALLALLAMLASRRRLGGGSEKSIAAFAVAGTLYVLAPSIAFAAVASNGDGARNYYLAWIYIAGAIGIAAAGSRATRAAGIALIGWLLLSQAGSLRQWQDSASSMRRLIAAMPEFASTIDDRQYAALLLPDIIGISVFARNAQGAIVSWPVQQRDYIDRIAGMTELDIEHWRDLLANHGLDRVHGQPLAVEDFVGVFCFKRDQTGFVQIDQGGRVPEVGWEARLRERVATGDCMEDTLSGR